MAKLYIEKRLNSLQEVIDYLDNSISIEEPLSTLLFGASALEVITLNGTELDALKLIEKYDLKFESERCNRNYTYCMKFPQSTPNTYCVGPTSMYGHIPYKLNVKGHGVNIIKNSKTNYESGYVSSLADGLMQDEKYVILDIETTGLSPVLDDIIQICIYENEKNYIARYLPLEKRDNNTAYEYNHIEEDLLQNQSPLTQDEVDQIIEKFDLENKTVVIWTGKNYFDRIFIESYFYQHDLKGLEKIKFYNGKNLLDLIENCPDGSKSKDSIALIYGIDITNAHDALEDCRIQHRIVENLLALNYGPFMGKKTYYENMLCEVKDLFFGKSINSTAEELYDNLCTELNIKNGRVLEDYDKKPRTRGRDWIDIHHMDEKILDNIATRTNEARKNQDFVELSRLSPYNKKERLVYATKVEHFLLHCLLNLINDIPSCGPHWLFGDLLKMEIGIFEKGSLAHNIQEKREATFYSTIDFASLVYIYGKVLNIQGLTLELAKDFYKLDTYIYDEEKFKDIMRKIETGFII